MKSIPRNPKASAKIGMGDIKTAVFGVFIKLQIHLMHGILKVSYFCRGFEATL